MKRKLDLRTGRPVWFAYRAPPVAAATLTRDVKADVLVVGMGVSGAMAAEALSARGHSVICIDRRGPMKGSTPATTALVQFEIDQPLTTLTRMIGKEQAVRAWRRSRLSVAGLKARIGELGIRCGMAERPSLYLAGNVMGPGDLKAESDARQSAGLYATYLPPAELQAQFGIKRDGAILGQGNLSLDPRRLTSGLFHAAISRGARLYAPAEARAFETGRDGVSVATAGGPVISVGHVVLATGYELAEGVPASGHQIVSTWAIATAPQKQAIWPQAAFIWEASDPYLYMRATDDGRIICGGEDEEFADEELRDALIAQKAAAISKKLQKLLPQVDPKPEFVWTGSFGTTATGLPRIGTVPGKPRLHAVLGYGGNGITYSQIASEIITASIEGREDTDADLFAFKR